MRSRRAAPPRQDNRADSLSLREEEQLKRLFSDPTKYPQTLKTWIISWLEGSDLSLPVSSINGLKGRLAQASGSNLIGGYYSGTTDANGKMTVLLGVTVTDMKGVSAMVSSSFPADRMTTLTLGSLTFTSFDVTVWNIVTNTAYANKPMTLSWIANITP